MYRRVSRIDYRISRMVVYPTAILCLYPFINPYDCWWIYTTIDTLWEYEFEKIFNRMFVWIWTDFIIFHVYGVYILSGTVHEMIILSIILHYPKKHTCMDCTYAYFFRIHKNNLPLSYINPWNIFFLLNQEGWIC